VPRPESRLNVDRINMSDSRELGMYSYKPGVPCYTFLVEANHTVHTGGQPHPEANHTCQAATVIIGHEPESGGAVRHTG
jgi:hypothetical protein